MCLQSTGLIWWTHLRSVLISQLTLLQQDVQLEAFWDHLLLLLSYVPLRTKLAGSQIPLEINSQNYFQIN